MLKTFITECTDCVNLLDLLCQIDKRLVYYTKNQYNNMTLMLNLDFNKEVIGDLLHYKRIVTKKLFFPAYAPDFTMYPIISRIKILLNK